MPQYCVNNVAQLNGDHEVHKAGCEYWPINKTNLGEHASCHTAVAMAKNYYRQSNGCAFCSPACHTS